MKEQRKIIHIDMDAFFASVEQHDNPALKGKPIVVGSSSERGVVAAASYEARKFGVRSAMAAAVAKRKCPQLVFVPRRMERYKEISKQVMDIFSEFTDLVEPLSIDEAFLDVTHNKKNISSATVVAQQIKHRIKEVTGLTASAGVSVNKFLAKIASDYRKPDGLFVIPPHKVASFVEELSVDKFYGVGKVTAEKMHKKGIYKGKDLKEYTLSELVYWFGKQGAYFYNIVRGIDDRKVNPNRIRKSVGTEHTFEKDIILKEDIEQYLFIVLEDLLKRLKRSNFKGRTLTLKFKYHNFVQETRSKTVSYILDKPSKIEVLMLELLQQGYPKENVRLLGLTISNRVIDDLPQQLRINFTSSIG